MTSPIVALKDAIRLRLIADPVVLGLLHEPKVFADPPKHAAFPHVAFISAQARENGTATDEGHSIDLTLGIWSRHKGSAEGLTISTAIAATLASMSAALAGHHLVNLSVRSVEPVLSRDGETWRSLMRIRAVTEVL
ncbi:MAG: DUF3168 domain-containing protein [Beijerinckiaceae bacterium]